MPRRRTDYTDFDEVAVERLVAGRHTGGVVRPADAAEATRRLVGKGFSDSQIALRLRYWRRSVIRIRQRLGIAAALPATGMNQNTLLVDAPGRSCGLG